MGRPVDRAVVQWAMTYAPFSVVVVKNTYKHVCDFCGNPHAKKVARLHSSKANKDLFACLGCESTTLVLEPAVRVKMMSGVFLQSEPLCNDARFKEAEKEAERIGEFQVVAPDVLKVKIEEVLHHRLKGRGKGWRIIPDLLRQYKERGTLTAKQIAVLDKFNRSCQKEH